VILRRLGNKTKIAKDIQTYFPQHDIYIEPFFGAGGMFFNKGTAKYSIVNDNDNDVYNLFQVVLNNKQELIDLIKIVPLHNELLTFWKTNREKTDVKNALRFLFLSNMTLLGTGTSLRYTTQEDRQQILDSIDETFNKIKNTTFNNVDFRKFLNSISFRHGKQDVDRTFIYADPPYIDTINNYKNGFTKQDTIDLFNKLIEMECKFAVSEFNSKFILSLAINNKLNVNYIGERRNLKNRRTEILVTNYENHPTLF